jgi:mRNA-degrading endonuclease RelE of RelBE toxin-antitoxin system
MPYQIVYARATEEHLRELTARQRSIVIDAVDRHLSHQPSVASRNRKPMRENPIAKWELRIGNLRAYYEIEETGQPTVNVLAIGVKRRNRVWIGRQEHEL